MIWLVALSSITLAALATSALAATCSTNKVDGGNTACAQRVAQRMCAQLQCGGSFSQQAITGVDVRVQGQMSNGACPTNCAAAVSNILSQCIANDFGTGTWQSGGEWYWIESVRNTSNGSAQC